MRLITFHTTTAALIAEVRIKELDKNVKLSPVPTKISATCGYVLITNLSKDKIIKMVGEGIIDIESLYEVKDQSEFVKIADI